MARQMSKAAASGKKGKIHRTQVQLNGNECHAPSTAQLTKAKAEEKLRARFADHAKHIKIQMLLINQLILKLGNRYRYRGMEEQSDHSRSFN